MPTMTPTTHLDVLAAAEHMPLGSRLVIHDLSWDEYEGVVGKLKPRSLRRLSYDRGRLEVVMISEEHERYAWLIDKFIVEFCIAHDFMLEGYGQATWKSKALSKGAQADHCYYVVNAPRVIGKKQIRLGTDPPPDIVLEVDLTSDSMRKLWIYAGLGVPEVWRFDGERFYFYQLGDGEYTEIPATRCLPGLTGSVLVEGLANCSVVGDMEALKAFRRHAKKLKK
jgi:Uma2 family endonuclease